MVDLLVRILVVGGTVVGALVVVAVVVAWLEAQARARDHEDWRR